MKSELIKIDKTEFVQKFDPVKMLTDYKHIKTTAQAIEADPNGVAFYSKHIGEDTVMAIIELHLVALNMSVNVGQPLTKFQIKEIAIEILSIFYYLSVIEIAYVLRKAKRGDFGKLYGVLNMVDILTWFTMYSEERAKNYIEKSTRDTQRDDSMRSEDRKILERHYILTKENQAKK